MTDPETWECGWEDARRRQLTAGLNVTPAQRLAWLEEMILLAHSRGALPRRKSPFLNPGGSPVKTKGDKKKGAS